MIVNGPELLARVREMADENIERNEWPRDSRSLIERLNEEVNDGDTGSGDPDTEG